VFSKGRQTPPGASIAAVSALGHGARSKHYARELDRRFFGVKLGDSDEQFLRWPSARRNSLRHIVKANMSLYQWGATRNRHGLRPLTQACDDSVLQGKSRGNRSAVSGFLELTEPRVLILGCFA
jgi:hypothetical protein